MMKRILLPTDFSENARSAVEYAINMFGYEDAIYILLNVYTEPNLNSDMLVSINDILEKKSKEELENEYNFFKKRSPTDLFKMEQQCVYGSLPYTVNTISKTENIDYIVMGTKGATGLKKAFIGSNTAEVIGLANCPVIAVPKNTKYTPPIRIAFASDYKEIENESILDPLINLAKQYQSELMIVNVHLEKELINAQQAIEGIKLHHVLESISHDFYDIEDKNTIDGIETFLENNNVNMVAMVARKHHFFSHLLQSSATKKMVMLTKIPLLILHEK